MRHFCVALISLVLTAHWSPARHARGGGFGGGPTRVVEPMEVIKYEPARLPLSAKAARTWITLRETMVKPLPDRTPFAAVIRSLRDATAGKDGKTSPLTIYVDPTSLKEAEITMATPVASPFVGEGEVSLHTYLGFILEPFGLSHRVHDGLVVIDIPCDDCPGPVEVGAAEAWTWLLLHEEVPLRFPDETPLEDVVKAICRETEGKGPVGRGLLIHLDPVGLREAEKAPGSPVTIELDRVPLCTSLGLLLKQLGLGFRVRDDGVVIITNFTVAEDNLLMDEADAVEGYQRLRYERFWERLNRSALAPRPDGRNRTSKNCSRCPGQNERRRHR